MRLTSAVLIRKRNSYHELQVFLVKRFDRSQSHAFLWHSGLQCGEQNASCGLVIGQALF